MVNVDLGVSAGIIHRNLVAREELSSLYWLNILTGIFIFIIFLFTREIISGIFAELKLSDILLWISVTFLIAPLVAQFTVLFNKNLKFDIVAKQAIIGQISQAILAITLAVYSFGV